MARIKDLPVSTMDVSLLFKLELLGMSNSETNSANTVEVGKPTLGMSRFLNS